MNAARFAQLMIRLERAERDMVRAMRKWDKLRGQVKRAASTLDKEFNAKAPGIGGEIDWTKGIQP